MKSITILICIFVSVAMSVAENKECTGSDCESIISMPLMDNMQATLKADLDVTKLNAFLKKYVQQEVKKGIAIAIKHSEETLTSALERIVENRTDGIRLNFDTSLDKHKKKIRQNIQEIKECSCGNTEVKDVAFHINLGKTLRNLKPNAAVVFDQVVLNIGGAYNQANGLFTCPEDGVYSFTWTALTAPNTSFESDFVVNGKALAGNRASSFNDNEYQPATKTVVVKLVKGDIANVAAHGSYAKHIHMYWSSFSGFRVY